jgi:hypothetical protein
MPLFLLRSRVEGRGQGQMKVSYFYSTQPESGKRFSIDKTKGGEVEQMNCVVSCGDQGWNAGLNASG